MAYRLAAFSGVGLDEALLTLVLDEHRAGTLPRLERFWTYYRNPLRPVGQGPSPSTSRGWYRQAQEVGLPARIVGRVGPGTDDRAAARREAVIENDIAWRVHTMVDFLVGKPVTIVSTAREESLRRTIDAVLDSVWEASGGIALLQDMATLAHVYGHADLLLRIDDEGQRATSLGAQSDGSDRSALDWASRLRIEVIDPTRGVPILDPSDYRRLAAYVIAFEREDNAAESKAWSPTGLWRRTGSGGAGGLRRKRSVVVEVISGDQRALFIDERPVEQQALTLTAGRVPIVHIQNISQPFRYEGLSEVEPLIPLQDELNTRLSDRASRVTLQSFKMYLAKGIEGFEKATVAPGQIWSTDNPDASVEAFGGDAASPSEESHIQEIREAMDKVSAVPPLAGGVVRARIGNLSSANALRITLMGLLGKTARKRVTYGRGIAEMCRLILTALDSAGVLKTDERDRGVRVEWPDPLPEDQRESVQAAEAKVRLGVDRERVLSELGYAPTDPGVT